MAFRIKNTESTVITKENLGGFTKRENKEGKAFIGAYDKAGKAYMSAVKCYSDYECKNPNGDYLVANYEFEEVKDE